MHKDAHLRTQFLDLKVFKMRGRPMPTAVKAVLMSVTTGDGEDAKKFFATPGGKRWLKKLKADKAKNATAAGQGRT